MKTKPKRNPASTRSRLSICSLLAVLLTLAASGCGQRGPLYLPDSANNGKQPAAQQEQGEESQKNEDESEDEKTP
jgi:predicted small lipoprotein YifL